MAEQIVNNSGKNGTTDSSGEYWDDFQNRMVPFNENSYLNTPSLKDAPIGKGRRGPLATNLYNEAKIEYNEESIDTGGDNTKLRSLQYPLNMTGNHYIRFSINISEESRLIKQGLAEVTGDADYSQQNRAFRNQDTTKALEAAAGLAVGVGAAKLGAAGVRKAFFGKVIRGGLVGAGLTAIGAGAAAYGAASLLSEPIADLMSEYFKVTNKIKRLAANITLYTPGNIRANYKFNYDMPEDLLVQMAQASNMNELQAGLKTMTDVFNPTEGEGVVQDAKKAFDNLGRFGRILASNVNPVSMLSRTVANRKKDVMFKYVGNRNFSFQFRFAPTNQTEAKEVDDIIYMFKRFAHPEMLPGYGSFLYTYPAEFDIEYGMVQGNPNMGPQNRIQNKYLNKISTCVITDMDVEYSTGSSFQSLHDGAPIITTLSLQFTEIEVLSRQRIEKERF